MTKAIRGISAALNSARYPFRSPELEADHLVVGGGVVGLAIARKLVTQYPDRSTYLVERHPRVGEETSSRNSEVVHGGFYYPVDSLKTKLCIRGRHLLYDYCKQKSVPVKRTGKLVVGHEHQRGYLEALHAKAKSVPWPDGDNLDPEAAGPVRVELLTGDEARALEPELAGSIALALHSKDTGIVDSHSFMDALEADITATEAGSVVLSTSVVRVDAQKDGFVVQMVTTSPTGEDSEIYAIMARKLISSAGLSGPFLLNALYRSSHGPIYGTPYWYAKGTYAAYRGPGVSKIRRLIYPVPESDAKSHGFAGLGTHLTIDMSGNIRFGPDIKWIEPPSTFNDDESIDFWKSHLAPSSDQILEMFSAIQKYLPGIVLEGLSPDYVGIRPKLAPPGSGFHDFSIQVDRSEQFTRNGGDGGGRIITLLGIESPGLTSSMAIAEVVAKHCK